MTSTSAISDAIGQLPPGAYAVAVSGGADSVALLHLLCDRATAQHDLKLHVVHLNHQTRGAETDGDAAFVLQLANANSLPLTIAALDQILPLLPNPTTNPSALYRQARLHLFRLVCQAHQLLGVVAAHHQDDQAETILLRLLQSAEPLGLCGMSAVTDFESLQIFRPLLNISRQQLRNYLHENSYTWREDSSNQSTQYNRNAVRIWLQQNPQMPPLLLRLGATCRKWKTLLDTNSPELPEQFAARDLATLQCPLAAHAARRWLHARGLEDRRASQDVIQRLIDMATDQASAAKQDFPGKISIRRKQGMIIVAKYLEA